jgi:hypothetical protein
MSWARRDFHPTTLGDAKSRDRYTPKSSTRTSTSTRTIDRLSTQSVICHLSFFPSAVYHNPDF